MRTRWIAMAMVCSTVLLGGCGAMVRKLDADNTFLVAAVPLDPDKVSACTTSTAADVACLAALVGDSREKCTAFVNGLVLHENTANTAFDALTTLLSAAATVTTPLRAAHILTGGATVSSGWKNSVNANIYAKMSIANYAQALDLTYTKHMRSYLDALGSASLSSISRPIEVQKIQFIHSECSLALAQGKITATLDQALQTVDTIAFSLGVAGTVQDSDVHLIFSRSGGETLTDIAYKVPSNATPQSMIDDIVGRINRDPTLGLGANHVSAVANGVTADIRAPVDLHLKLDSTNKSVFTVTPKSSS